MSRFYCPDIETGVLDREESHHACNVLRMKSGDACTVFDGRGREALVRLTEVHKQAVRYAVISVSNKNEPVCRLILGQAIPKAKAWDLILQKATELGLHEIYPIASAHSVAHVEESRKEAKQEKWQQALIEACKQCGQDYLPVLHPVMNMCEFIDANREFKGLKLIASLQPGAHSLKSVLRDVNHKEVLFLVGPEGDFSREEIELAVSAGYLPISLGDNVLRTETAALFMISVLGYQLGE
jgi:16S rRNA (uracil1498-N3)-methyltransferase